MRLRQVTIGALNVFLDDRVVLTEADLVVGQALADAATIAILHDRQVREQQVVMAQLQGALTSRVVIEQAKGMLAEPRPRPALSNATGDLSRPIPGRRAEIGCRATHGASVPCQAWPARPTSPELRCPGPW